MSFYKYALEKSEKAEASASSDALKGSLMGSLALGLAAPKYVERSLDAVDFGGVDHDRPWKLVRSTNPLELREMYKKNLSEEGWKAFERQAVADDEARKGLAKLLHRAKNLGMWAAPGVALGGAVGALGGLAFHGTRSLFDE